jgi:soluble lytic murein transglycosylase-like protein
MAALRRLLAPVALALTFACLTEPACGQSRSSDRWDDLIAEASQTFDLPQSWIRNVMRVESGGQTLLNGRPITSAAGAMGLMQIMPRTWAYLRDRYGFGADPYDPRDNIFAGAAFLRELYLQYGYPNLFAAYSAGPSRLDSFLQGGSTLPPETSAYLSRLGGLNPVGPTEVSQPAGARLFFDLKPSPARAAAIGAGGLFVPLRTR